MKLLTLIALLMLAYQSQASCKKELAEAKKNDLSTLIITFDGLGTAELKSRLLQRHFVGAAKKRCKSIAGADFYYSKRGAKKAVACAKSFKEHFGSALRINIVGHSFGGGKGVFNFLKAAKKAGLSVDNAITFDPRGYSYKYTNPAGTLVNHFVNIYQKVPLAGMLVKGADMEFNVTGKSSHVALPRKFSDFALDKSRGSLNCK